MPVQPYVDDILKVAKANANVNPYAGLFDYDEMAKEEEARKLKLQEGQKRIQRTNAIGDALRLISEGVTGSMGASIAPRAVNPGIMQASQRINALEDQSQSNMDRIRLQDLAMKEKGLTYDLGQKATQQQREWETGQTEAKNRFAESQLNKELGSREKINAEDNASMERRTRDTNRINLQKVQETVEGRAQLEMMKRDQQTDAALAKKGMFKVARYDNPQEDVIVSRNQVIALLPELKKYAMANKLYPLPKILQTNQFTAKVQDDQLKVMISQYADFFRAKLPELSGIDEMPQQPTFNSPLLNGMFQQPGRVPYTPGQGPLRPTGVAAPAPVAPVVQQLNPVEAVKGILPDAQTIYSKAESADQVMNELKALINTRYQDASPQEKATIYNDLIKQF